MVNVVTVVCIITGPILGIFLVYIGPALKRLKHLEQDKLEQQEASRAREEQARVDRIIKSLEGLDQLPAIIQGLMEMAKFAAAQTDALNKAVELLQSSMASSEDNYEDYAEDTPVAIRAQERQEVKGLMSQGVAEEEANRRVRERSIYEHLKAVR